MLQRTYRLLECFYHVPKANGYLGILYAMEMVEGKDRPKKRAINPNNMKIGKMGALLLRICQSILTTSKVVILDSGVYILRVIIELQKQGVFSSTLVKKAELLV